MNTRIRDSACSRGRARPLATSFRSRHPVRRSLLLLRAAVLPAAQDSSEAMPSQLLLTVREAAAVLRISHWTLYRLIQQRQLQTITIGRRRLVPRDAIENFLAQLRQEAA
jgi:excisionase family DNA binding protein